MERVVESARNETGRKELPGALLRVFIVDDHPVVVDGVRALVESHPRMTVCGAAMSAEDARAQVTFLKPDIAIVDLGLKQTSGVELIDDFVRCGVGHVVVYTQFDTNEHREECLRRGASAFVPKSASGFDLRDLLASYCDTERVAWPEAHSPAGSAQLR